MTTIKLTNIRRFVSNDLLTDKFTAAPSSGWEIPLRNGVRSIKPGGEIFCARWILMEIFILPLLRVAFFKRINISPLTSAGKACVSLMECILIVSIDVLSVVASTRTDVISRHCYANHNSNISLVTYEYGTLFHSWLDLCRRREFYASVSDIL